MSYKLSEASLFFLMNYSLLYQKPNTFVLYRAIRELPLHWYMKRFCLTVGAIHESPVNIPVNAR